MQKPTSKGALKLAQKYYAAREDRLAADKVVELKKEVETSLKMQLIVMLHALEINSVGDPQRIYALVTKPEPQVEDWSRLYGHIKQTGEFELLFRRINPGAIKERWDAKEEVPGVGKFPVETLSVTKAKGV